MSPRSEVSERRAQIIEAALTSFLRHGYNKTTMDDIVDGCGLSKGTLLMERIHEALRMTGLERRDNLHTRHLSDGWRQRLALNAAILHRPELVFLDEPTAGVDPISRRAFWDLLYRLGARGITVFVTTHYMDEAEHCHRLALIQRGAMIACGSPEEIKHEKMKGQVLEIA
ncbi:MAG: AAA family ATPase, partial [Anaerolineae bacterium]